MEKIIGTLPSQMGFRQPDGGESVVDILRGRIRCQPFLPEEGGFRPLFRFPGRQAPECRLTTRPQLPSRPESGDETGNGRVPWKTNGCELGAAGRPK